MSLVGLKNLYYAIVESDTATTTTYGTPVKIGEAISVDINPTVNETKLFGDDMAVAVDNSLGEITVTIETTNIPLEDLANLLGHTYDSDSDTLIAKSSDSSGSAYVALLFESDKHDGGTRCVKLTKGRFKPSQETINTKGENLEYQSPRLEGTFISRLSDGVWKIVKDYAKGASTADWYTSV